MTEKYDASLKRIIRLILIIIGSLAGLFTVVKVSYYLAPFIIAFLLASLMEPIIRLLMKRARFSRKAAAPLVLLLVLFLLGFIITMVILKLISELKSLSPFIPGFFNDLFNNITVLINKSTDAYSWLPPEITGNLGSLVSNISSTLVKFANSIVKSAFAIGFSIPEAVIFIISTIVSTYFLSSDRDRILVFFRSQLPESWLKEVSGLKNDMFSALFGYLRAQLILMSITFTELYIGFSLIHIKYSLLLAFFISIIDALPILGTGTVLVPWGVYSLIFGDIRMGASILILYVVVLIIRQLIEPKIVGNQIGVYPLVTLIAMYIGLKIFGVLGLILGPITVLLLKNIFTAAFKNRTIKDFFKKSRPIS
jgi:sporulation integral membrane protein YtvI